MMPATDALSARRRAVAVPSRCFRGRGDPKFLRLTADLSAALASPRFPLVRLERLLTEKIAYGTSSRLSGEPPGHRVLRMPNVTEDGWDLTELKYLEVETPPEAWRLRRGDIVVNRTNSEELVGKAAVFDLNEDFGLWLYASYLLRLRVDRSIVHPRFLVAFLNSPAGRLQVNRVSRRAVGMANINSAEIADFLVPLPPLDEQTKLLEPLLSAFDERLARIAEARAVLVSTDEELLASVGISFHNEFDGRSYGTTGRNASAISRLGAQFFHPERATALRAVLDASVGVARPLGKLAEFVNDRCVPSLDETYVGLSAVEPHTGELVPVGEEASDAKRYRRGDVLFARLRPYLNKVHFAETDGVCSTEFYVLRPTRGVDGRFLAMALRSKLTLAQTRHMMTGNTHPRVVEADTRQLAIRVPESEVQRSLASVSLTRRDDAVALRTSAEEAWVRAQRAFDGALLEVHSSPR